MSDVSNGWLAEQLGMGSGGAEARGSLFADWWSMPVGLELFVGEEAVSGFTIDAIRQWLDELNADGRPAPTVQIRRHLSARALLKRLWLGYVTIEVSPPERV